MKPINGYNDLDEAPPSYDICGASRVFQHSSHLIVEEVYRVLADVCSDDEGIVVGKCLSFKSASHT